MIDGVEMYEVEDILGERTKRKTIRGRRQTEKQYLVKWKGYGTAEASWEPARAVDAPQVLKAYKLRQQEQDAVQDDSDSDEQDSVD